jgi:hypothetical protein
MGNLLIFSLMIIHKNFDLNSLTKMHNHDTMLH